MKALIYAINGKGLGHLSRTHVIADSLTASDPDLKIEFVTGTTRMSVIREFGYPVMRIPSTSTPYNYDLFHGKVRWLETQMICAAVQDFEPDFVLYDFLLNTHVFSKVHSTGALNLLILRKQKKKCLEKIVRHSAFSLVDLIIFPHDEAELMDFAPLFPKDKLCFTGPVVRPLKLGEIDRSHEYYFPFKMPFILLTIGGGGAQEARDWFRRCIAVLKQIIQEYPRMHVLAVKGPLFKDDLDPETGDKRIIIVDWADSIRELMAASELVLCNSGYNTANEVLASGTPAVIYPLGSTGWDDQMERARWLETQKAALICNNDSEDIQRCILDILKREVIHRRDIFQDTTGMPFHRLGKQIMDSIRSISTPRRISA
jgi:UDP-N-acetylglucosamine--N-acetylmuramyl-(pentapeptide) pyrophosphoryl-undecaprenol N-acetylglucosamine transferase